jgi:hypothetical protein
MGGFFPWLRQRGPLEDRHQCLPCQIPKLRGYDSQSDLFLPEKTRHFRMQRQLDFRACFPTPTCFILLVNSSDLEEEPVSGKVVLNRFKHWTVYTSNCLNTFNSRVHMFKLFQHIHRILDMATLILEQWDLVTLLWRLSMFKHFFKHV